MDNIEEMQTNIPTKSTAHYIERINDAVTNLISTPKTLFKDLDVRQKNMISNMVVDNNFNECSLIKLISIKDITINVIVVNNNNVNGFITDYDSNFNKVIYILIGEKFFKDDTPYDDYTTIVFNIFNSIFYILYGNNRCTFATYTALILTFNMVATNIKQYQDVSDKCKNIEIFKRFIEKEQSDQNSKPVSGIIDVCIDIINTNGNIINELLVDGGLYCLMGA